VSAPFDVEEQVRALRERSTRLSRFAQRLERLLWDLLEDNPLLGRTLQVVTSRVKTEDSFREKCTRDGKNYTNPIDQKTDLVGVRIVLYSQASKEIVYKLLHDNFAVDEDNSIDYEKTGHERGYRGWNVIAALSDDRKQLAEWRRYVDIVFEVQIVTVAHHAWSQVQHGAIYKNREEPLPQELRSELTMANELVKQADDIFERVFNAIDERVAADEAVHSEDG